MKRSSFHRTPQAPATRVRQPNRALVAYSLAAIPVFAVLLQAGFFSTFFSFMLGILGLGLVIFFHELGHFAVAKWCNVYVERFSIGFGPIIWSFTRGETEYALSAIPFGGYVKMLGQDDMDPSQLTSDQIAADPRSYSAKSVPQRMAIISAGVIMNIVTGLLFCAIAFGVGVKTPAAVVGHVQAGMPAWNVGVRPGDELLEINGNPIDSFADVPREVALTTGTIELKGRHVGLDGEPGEEYTATITPDRSGSRRIIGVGPSQSLTLIPENPDEIPPTVTGMPADNAEPPFEPSDRIVEIDGESVRSFTHLQDLLARRADKKVVFTVERPTGDDGDETTRVDITVPPIGFRTLGLRMDIGLISAIRQNSPAAEAGFKLRDKLKFVVEDPEAWRAAKERESQGTAETTETGTADEQSTDSDESETESTPDRKSFEKAIPTDLDPLFLPNYFASRAGKPTLVIVQRARENGEDEMVELEVTPEDRPGWIETPRPAETPLAVPSLGLAYPVMRNVTRVEPGSPAYGQLREFDRVKTMTLIRAEDAAPDGYEEQKLVIDLDQETPNWAYAFWVMQMTPGRTIELAVQGKDGDKTVTLTPTRSDEYFLPVRGIRTYPELTTLEADSAVGSLVMAGVHTKETAGQIYLTIRNLISRDLSPKELRGPLGITMVATKVAEQGMADLLLFLGFLSVNLAVLNFLPIPVLDGGHMVFLIWEGVTRKKPSPKVMEFATYLGLAFVLLLMFTVVYLDIFVHKLKL